MSGVHRTLSGRALLRRRRRGSSPAEPAPPDERSASPGAGSARRSGRSAGGFDGDDPGAGGAVGPDGGDEHRSALRSGSFAPGNPDRHRTRGDHFRGRSRSAGSGRSGPLSRGREPRDGAGRQRAVGGSGVLGKRTPRRGRTAVESPGRRERRVRPAPSAERRERASRVVRGLRRAAALTGNCEWTCAGRSGSRRGAGRRFGRRGAGTAGAPVVFPTYRGKPRGGEAPGLRERGRGGQATGAPPVRFVLGQFIVQVTKFPTFAVPKLLAVPPLASPVRSSSPSASQVQVKDTSIVWVHSFES